MKTVKFNLLIILLFLISGCGNTNAVEGKIYFLSNNFGKGETMYDAEGLCVFKSGKPEKVKRSINKAIITKDDKWLAYGYKKADKIYIRNIETGEENIFHPQHYASEYRFLDNMKKMVYLGYDLRKVKKGNPYKYNFYLVDLKNNKENQLTDITEGIYVDNLIVSPGEKYIFYNQSLAGKVGSESRIKKLYIETGVVETIPFSCTNLAISPDGKKLYIWGVHESVKGNRFYIYDLKTKIYQEFPKKGEYLWEKEYTFSPDGTKVAYIRWENNGKKSLWVMDADRSNQKKLFEWGYMIKDLSWTD